MIVYVDVLFIINLCANFLVLALMREVSGYQISNKRGVAAATLGSLYGCMMIVKELSFLYGMAGKILCSLLMVYIAAGYGGRHQFTKKMMFFYGISGVFGGSVMLLNTLMKSTTNLFYASVGVFSASSNFWGLLLELFITYFVVSVIYSQIICEKLKGRNYYMLKIVRGNQECILKGFMDTGNGLTDFASGDPVVVAHYPSIKKLFTQEEILALTQIMKGTYGKTEAAYHFHLITYHTIGVKKKLMPVFAPDEFYIEEDKGFRRVEHVVIGISEYPVSTDGTYDMLLQMKLINHMNTRGNSDELAQKCDF